MVQNPIYLLSMQHFVLLLLLKGMPNVLRIHISFFTGSVPVSTTQQVQQESELKKAHGRASACIGHIIGMGATMLHRDTLLFYHSKVLQFVQQKLSGVHFRVHKYRYSYTFRADCQFTTFFDPTINSQEALTRTFTLQIR